MPDPVAPPEATPASGHPGADIVQHMLDAGFDPGEVSKWKDGLKGQMFTGGVEPKELANYWGEADNAPMAKAAAAIQSSIGALTPDQTARFAENPMEAFRAGLQMSATSLMAGKPEIGLSQNPTLPQKVAAAAGQTVGDLPEMILGFGLGAFGGAAAGGAAGSAVPVVGNAAGAAVGGVVGAGAGGAALPELMRDVLMDQYAHPEGYKTWGDFWASAADIAAKTGKSALIGGLANYVGGAVGSRFLEAGAARGSNFAAAGSDIAAQIGAATTVGAALEGRVPNFDDFVTNAAVMVGLSGAGVVVGATKRFVPSRSTSDVAANLRDVYAKTGLTPQDAVRAAMHDPGLASELLAPRNVDGEAYTPGLKQIAPPEPAPYAAEKPMKVEPQPPAEPGAEPPNPRPEPNKLVTPTPEEVSDAHLSIFRTLEGNADGHADHAVSPAGAIGRNQIMPTTARGYGFDPSRLQDPAYNDTVAKVIISDLSNKFDGNLTDMLVAYNAGPGQARAWIAGGRKIEDLPAETQHYLQRAEDKGFTRGNMNYEIAGRNLAVQGDAGQWVPPAGELPEESFAQALARVGEGGAGGKEPPRIGADNGLNIPPSGLPKIEGFTYTDDVLLDRMSDIIAPEKSQGLLPDWLNPRKVLTAFQSQLAPARRIDRQIELKPGQVGVEDMARQVYAAKARAAYALFEGTLKINGNQIDEGSKASWKAAYNAIKEDGGTGKGFVEYLIAKRTVEKFAQGVKTGADLPSAQQIVARDSIAAKYERGAGILRESKDALVDYARESGVFSDAQAAAMKDLNQDHIVFRRVMDPDYNPPGVGGRNWLRPRSPTKVMKGSDRLIVDPLTAEIDNYHTFVAMADRNRAVGNVIALVEGSHRLTQNGPDTKLLWHDRTDGSPSKPMDLFDEQGNPIPPEAAAPLAPFLAERGGGGLGPNEFPYYRDGQREIWKARDPDLAQMMRAPPVQEWNPVHKGFAAIASVARFGLVSTPDFLLRALIHGQLASAAFGEGGRKVPFLDIVHGMADVLGKTEELKEAARNGALAGAITDIDRVYGQRDMDALFEQTGTREAVPNLFAHPIEALRALHSILDSSARVGAMQRMEEGGASPLKAASQARTMYLDHAEQRASSWLRNFTSVVPFMEIGFKDVEQVANAFRRDPVKASITAASILAAPTLTLYAANAIADQFLDEKDRYHELPQWQRDMYWVMPPVGGVRLKIMKPYVGGYLFSTLPERMLDTFFHPGQGLARGALDNLKAAFDQMVPPFMPTGTTPILENLTGYSFYQNRGLVPASLEKLSGYMQYKPDTTEVSKGLSKALGPAGLNLADFSPIKTENLVRGWAGTLPMDLLRILDKPFEGPKRPDQIADIPFVGSFFARNPEGRQTVEDFYEKAHEFTQAHADVLAARKQGDMGLVTPFILMEGAVKVDYYLKALGHAGSVLAVVNRDKDMTRDEKLKQSDAIARQMYAISKQGLDILGQEKAAR